MLSEARMMLAKTHASAVQGVDAIPITVEVSAGGKIVPASKKFYWMVGLPDSVVKEGFQRLEAAIKNIGFRMLRLKLVVSLAPADIRKEGSSYDLPIAVGILAATRQMRTEQLKDYVLMGELALDGELKPIKGILPIAIQARKDRFKGLIVPEANAKEAAIVNNLEVYGAGNLRDVVAFLNGKRNLKKIEVDSRGLFENLSNRYNSDFSDVKGQENIKRALEIAASGGHNAILIGPPGSGKTMLARRMPTILPHLTLHEALETTKIHSVAGMLGSEHSLITVRPFRSPHHTISDVALVGGGSHPSPGEISLANNGVLFLDELPEFKRSVIEVLRQPLEERRVTISRAKVTVDYPANFILLASMNPCPCGYHNHPDKECLCDQGMVKRYLNKISGPLMDRIDLHVEVTPVSYEELSDQSQHGESSSEIRERVIKARKVQERRFSSRTGLYANAQMHPRMVCEVCQLDTACTTLLKTAMNKLRLSARAYDRILKVSRTIADLAGSKDILVEHLAEAIHFRSLDREGWSG